jgi:hypothetical protein
MKPESTSRAPEVWTLSFKATGNGPPAEIRIRQLLKVALRRFGLKCVGAGDGKDVERE